MVARDDEALIMNVDVTVRGPVSRRAARSAAEKVASLEHLVKGPVMSARIVLTQERNPRIEHQARAEGVIVLAGRPLRGRVTATSMPAAVDAIVDRLGDQLRRHVDQLVTREQLAATLAPGQWRHAAWSPPRPSRTRRPPGDRALIRRKTYAIEPIDAADAAADMLALDHAFYLSHDAETGADAVLYRRDDGTLAVIQPPGTPVPAFGPEREPSRYSAPLELATALEEMDALDHRFVFFVDAASGRGCVLYLRHDGHYGLIEPAA